MLGHLHADLHEHCITWMVDFLSGGLALVLTASKGGLHAADAAACEALTQHTSLCAGPAVQRPHRDPAGMQSSALLTEPAAASFTTLTTGTGPASGAAPLHRKHMRSVLQAAAQAQRRHLKVAAKYAIPSAANS